MFGFLKKWLDKPANTLQEYFNDVIKKSENNSCERFATFTPQGLNLIIELLIQKSQYNLNMFIEKREIYFDALKLDMLEKNCNNLSSQAAKSISLPLAVVRTIRLLNCKPYIPRVFIIVR